MSKVTIEKRKDMRVVVFSLLLLPVLAASPSGFPFINFTAMAQEEASSSSSSNQTEIIVVAQTPEEQANLDRFDRLDFEGWNNQNWTLFEEMHSPDVFVDINGNTTSGIEEHLQFGMAALSAAPEDLKILDHPIKIAAGDWTAVIGTLPGNVTMMTLARWEDGRIAEEYIWIPSPSGTMNQTEPAQQ
jgi:SnoaL-like protein